MKKMLFATLAILFAAIANASGVTPKSVRVADMIVKATWSANQAAFSDLRTTVEQSLVAQGASERGARIFSRELAASFSQEALTQIYAESLSEEFADAELDELAAFFEGQVGRKYLLSASKLASNQQTISPLLKQACFRAIKELGSSADVEITSMCKKL